MLPEALWLKFKQHLLQAAVCRRTAQFASQLRPLVTFHEERPDDLRSLDSSSVGNRPSRVSASPQAPCEVG